MDDIPLTRGAALAQLARFAPKAGSAYGARRNLVDPNGRHDHVSGLSAALRRRLIGEDEVVRAVLRHHRTENCSQFIDEVFWRTYWKGWLEQRPGVWRNYVADCATMRHGTAVNEATAEAIAGRTGIDAFDHWAQELAETGYLHNWARMQVASIWVFTLELPWQLGAQWFYEMLVDADPACNTLSWRWVAGLHTADKTYLADADRIAALTGGRFRPEGLALTAHVPDDRPHPPQGPLREPLAIDPALPTLVLITPEDCSLETELPPLNVRIVTVANDTARNVWDQAALGDAASRAAAHWRCPVGSGDVATLAMQHGCKQVVTGFTPVGPIADAIAALGKALETRGISLAEHQRDWDRLCWPHCGKNFFNLKSRIPYFLEDLALA